MSESAEGVIEPLTRQKSGSFVKSAANPGKGGCGDWKAPAATVSVPSVVWGIASVASSPQDRGAASGVEAALDA